MAVALLNPAATVSFTRAVGMSIRCDHGHSYGSGFRRIKQRRAANRLRFGHVEDRLERGRIWPPRQRGLHWRKSAQVGVPWFGRGAHGFRRNRYLWCVECDYDSAFQCNSVAGKNLAATRTVRGREDTL
jgi:hypothetical protein